MGMYTGIKFKGYVKSNFRDDFEKIALNGESKNYSNFKKKEKVIIK